MSKSRLVSGRIKKATGTELSTDRYEYLDLANAEPDLGVPAVDESVLIGDINGTRTWVDIATYADEFKGFTGSQGDVGFVGSQGDQGYTGSKGAVDATVSSTPPATPSLGDVWIDSATGIQYFYVDDGDSAQWVEFSNPGTFGVAASTVVLQPTELITPESGTLEYDGRVPYFTPQGTQRGVIPGAQYYCTAAGIAGANSTAVQSILGVGVTLSSGTIYEFTGNFNFFKTAGTTTHAFRLAWGGTATAHRIITNVLSVHSNQGFITVNTSRTVYQATMENAGPITVTIARNSAFATVNLQIRGIIAVNQGGTLIPQYALTTAPGGGYTAAASNYMSIWPIGAGNSTAVNVGTWA